MKKLLFLIMLNSIFSTLLSHNFSNPTNMLSYIARYLPQAPVILEAGGNVGEDTKRMKTVWPDATMHVFEPLPWSFKALSQNTAHLSHTTCYEYALTNYSGTTNFFVDIPNNGSSSIGRPLEFNAVEFDETPLQVECITLDKWAQDHKIEHIDFMWLDMESHELYALEYGTKLLSTVKAIYTEINFVPVREGSKLYPALKEFLEQHGFKEIWKERFGRFGNALFIKQDLLP